MSKRKVETVDEYLARGGKITKVSTPEREKVVEVVRTTTAGEPATLLSLDEAALFYGEADKKVKAKKPKPTGPTIDINMLPPDLRNKYIARLKEDFSGEDYEENFEEVEDKEDDQEEGSEE